MDVLLVESHPGLGCQARRELEAVGHTVVSCFGDDLRTPCGGLVDDADCPLDTHEAAIVRAAIEASRADDRTAAVIDVMVRHC